jgi:hypothetical protein
MKTQIVLFLLAMIVSLPLHAQQPSPITANTFTGAAPVIDADETDNAWKNATAHPINVIFKDEASGFGPNGSGDLDAWFKMLEDGNKIYLLVVADDDIVCQSTNSQEYWIGDCIEIYIGLPGYNPELGGKAEHAHKHRVRAIDETLPVTNGIESSCFITDKGYIMEVAIDRTAALESVPAGQIAFDIMMADNDEGFVFKGVRYRKSWFNDGAIAELNAKMVGAGKVTLNLNTGASGVKQVSDEVSYKICDDKLQLLSVQTANISIYNAEGKLQFTQANGNQADLSKLPAGIYFAKITSPDINSTGSIKFVKY